MVNSDCQQCARRSVNRCYVIDHHYAVKVCCWWCWNGRAYLSCFVVGFQANCVWFYLD